MRAKLFRNGRSQAVRLPAEFRFEGTEVEVHRDPESGAVVFHAQQCVEKLLKASRQREALDGQWSWDAEELSDLSSGAVLARYPGFETSAEEQADLVQIASGLREALMILLGSVQPAE